MTHKLLPREPSEEMMTGQEIDDLSVRIIETSGRPHYRLSELDRLCAQAKRAAPSPLIVVSEEAVRDAREFVNLYPAESTLGRMSRELLRLAALLGEAGEKTRHGQNAAGQSPVSASAGAISSNAEADRRGQPDEKGPHGDMTEGRDAHLRSATSDKTGGLNPAPAAPTLTQSKGGDADDAKRSDAGTVGSADAVTGSAHASAEREVGMPSEPAKPRWADTDDVVRYAVDMVGYADTLRAHASALEKQLEEAKKEAAINLENFRTTNAALVSYDNARIAAETHFNALLQRATAAESAAQTARASALEEAARLCEAKIQYNPSTSHYIDCANAAHANDARSIRALIAAQGKK